MARLRRLIHSVTSGYAFLLANVVFSLVQIPLALRYLSKAEFGLWALAFQIGTYLQFVDFGMSSSVSRLLIDHKHERNGGIYGSTIQTGFLVLLVQGSLILLGGVAVTLAFSRWLNISPNLLPTFEWLMSGLCLMLAITFFTKIFSHLLAAHQRFDVINYAQIGLFAINFFVQWLCFHFGFGVFSILWGNAAGWLLMALVTAAACLHFEMFPSAGAWGKPTRARFWEIFAFGKDVFWVSLGSQLIVASQTIIVTRSLGLNAAATWSVCTRAYTLVSLVVWRIFDYAAPALAEMIVLKEIARLYDRLKSLVIASTSLAAVGGVMFAICNQPFIMLWTAGKIGWSQRNDALLGLWLVLSALVHSLCGFALTTKVVGFMKHIYVIEGVTFIVVGSYVAPVGGFAGLILTSVICTSLFTLPYGIWRAHDYFHIPLRELIVDWMIPPIRLLLMFGSIGFGVWYVVKHLDPWIQLITYCALGCFGMVLLLRYGIDRQLAMEIQTRSPASLRSTFATITAGD